ncbi:MAG: tRNA pseudouridine(38-40) synthase TruA [Verrucomicrobiota bacterium]|nr:tRNA pseudouridine(38-40) synthase TruA [Verrucomicrobiota bacterium]
MAYRLKLIVAYDGRPFAGFQSQANGNAVQDHLERAFQEIARAPVRVHGAGRTDAGVHAIAQAAHVELVARTLDARQWVAALNTHLPATLRVLRCTYVPVTFHARFSARGKVYRYRIWNDAVLPPLDLGRAWHVPVPLDVDTMRSEAQAFLGRHNFAAFAANRGKPVEHAIRTIDGVQLRASGRSVVLQFSGEGFLYKMVRLMTGALVRCGHGKSPAGEIVHRLRAPESSSPSARLVAPAEGLYLVRVRY